MQERERRRRYRDNAVATGAPSKLIGYVSAGSLECPHAPPRGRRRGGGGRWVVFAMVAALAALWLAFGGAFAILG